LWHQREKLWRGARPEPDGSFRIERIPPGDVTLDVHAGAFPWVGLGEPSVEGGAVVDVGTVRLEPAGTLAGRLTGLRDGDAARVTLELEGGGTLLGGGGALHRDGRAFASGPLKAGRYTLRAAGDRVETATAECDVVAGRETRVELALRAAAMRRVVISAPAAGEPPYAVACEVQGGERTAWDGWTVLDAPGPRELRVSVAPGTYRLLIRDRYADERVLHDGTLEVHGDARDDVPRVVTLEAPAEPDGE
jgi:hypothetical protein